MTLSSSSADRAASSALVELRDVHFGYGERPVLKGLSLTVPRGKVTALMGASGGGKTTVLRLIGGQQRAQQGEVLVGGQDVGRMDTDQPIETPSSIMRSYVPDADTDPVAAVYAALGKGRGNTVKAYKPVFAGKLSRLSPTAVIEPPMFAVMEPGTGGWNGRPEGLRWGGF